MVTLLTIFAKPITQPIGRADMEFYYGDFVYRMALLLSGYDDARWEKLGYRSRQKWLNRAGEATCRLFNDADIVSRLPALVKNLQERNA